MTVILSPSPVFQAFAPNGQPLVGGQLFTFAAGTTTPQATFIDSTQTTQNTNPVILNSMGQASVWLATNQAYKFVLTDQFGNQISTTDQVQGTLTAATFTQSFIGGIFFPPGDSRRYGATGNGVYDDTAAINNWIKAVVQGQLAGALYPGTYVISSPIVVNLMGRGFSLLGPSSSACVFEIASTFAGGTAALQVKGNGGPCQFHLGGFNVTPSGSGAGTATTGLLVGDPTTAALNIFGFQSSTISDLLIDNFDILCQITNARLIRFEDCGFWNPSGSTPTGTLITQGSGTSPGFAGDLLFDRCQWVAATAANNTCVNLQSTVGPFNNSTGVGVIAGISFRGCDYFAGDVCINALASDAAWITDIWFVDGCQIDQQTTNCMLWTSNGTSSNVQDIHIEDMFFNKSTGTTIGFTSTGTGGDIQNIWVQNNWIDQAESNAIGFFGANCLDLHVNNNSIIDASVVGRAIEFNGCARISCSGNRAITGLFNSKPEWLIGFDPGCTDIYASGNDGVGMTTSGATIIDQSGAVTKTIVNNLGYNPLPTTGITVGASPFTFTNTTGAAVVVSVGGGTVIGLSVNGLGVNPGTNLQLTVQAGGSMTVTYTAAPSMNYFGL
jgi:hypothetical protein